MNTVPLNDSRSLHRLKQPRHPLALSALPLFAFAPVAYCCAYTNMARDGLAVGVDAVEIRGLGSFEFSHVVSLRAALGRLVAQL